MEIKADTHEPIDITWPDGSTMRLRWDPSEGGVRVSAESVTHDGEPTYASSLTIEPRCHSGIILRAS